MTSQQIRQILCQSYQPNNWKRLLNALFPDRDFLSRPVEKDPQNLEQEKLAERIAQFGEVRLADNSQIGFYMVELKAGGTSIAKNRVGLRNLISRDVIPGILDGILVVYYIPGVSEWRMSFISKQAYWDDEGNLLREETQPRRYTYVFGPEESCNTAIERFTILLEHAQEMRIEHLLQAFSVEKISGAFFDQYHHHFKTLAGYLEQSVHRAQFEAFFAEEPDPDEQTRKTDLAIRNFVKKLMGRLVFLHFLQKKGWMGATDLNWRDGRRAFINDLFNECAEPDDFYRTILTELFFNTLNNAKRPEFDFLIKGTTPFADGVVRKVPYLNGGLFERDAHEPIELAFKATDFRALLDFFGSYNFTIDENLPADQDIGVDPEMLGLIFENLLEDNKDKGTFYTPKEVVHYMCRESLSLYLRRKLQTILSPGEMRTLDTFIKGDRNWIPEVVVQQADAIYEALDTVRICDPAIGSGAFPMGLVLELFDLKRKLSGLRARPRDFNFHVEKLRIIRENIYGVDIDKGAVDIARLRFWLSLIVDEEKPSPLPNLDYKIMQGDSLTESFEGIPLDNVLSQQKSVVLVEGRQMGIFGDSGAMQTKLDLSDQERDNLKMLVNTYFDPTLFDKSKTRQRIDAIIHDNIEYNFELTHKQISRFIHEKEDELTLVPADSPRDSPAKLLQKAKSRERIGRELAKRQQEERILLAKREKLLALEQKADEKPYFLWHLFFNEILTGEADAGFDIVIGNPPYGVKVSEELTKHYGLQSKDSYGTFMSMALRKLLRPDGVLCYIVSDTWLTIKSHLPLRKMLLEQQLHKVIRLHADCFKAVVNSCIFTLTRPVLPPTKAPAPQPAEIIVADLTNISTRKDIPKFRELILNLETFVGEATPHYAVYTYPQSLITTNSHLPIFVASPKLFRLMNDTGLSHKTNSWVIN
ncbi:hypothetical protein GCM10027275_35780 [Rhabdobacter roseus]|uniref:site-specific DNA-methyltransferase (adenine-specific) n=1 Tax=Rhabdobacter roseus TaxID=1655419 RepID=A0A840TZ70_9BACT|nr:Eco57I restriction-modification methylase domain-containing protein [Rhabdobacter roseus]MBB5285200.1 hypothetical protein [Rhabdobacter roseus]